MKANEELRRLQTIISAVYKEIWERDDFGYFDIWAEITKEESGYKITEYFISWKDPKRQKHSRVLVEGISEISGLELAFKTAVTTDSWCFLTEEEYNGLTISHK